MKSAALAALLLGSTGLAASPTVSARLSVQRSGTTLSHALKLHNRLAVPFRAAYVCTLETALVNAAGRVVRQYPPEDTACPSTYFWLSVPARGRATVFQHKLPWNLSEVPPGVYRVRARLPLFRVPAAFQVSKLVTWSAPFTLPGK
ncbi:hypothetical protein QOL99_03605 [Deinococcus sp. MIMF12]|uniref:Intracellular proteinase inhibitor BsuPI domain-containing protein n=1 Tax=Deinococcus rhizophilus TaxID=3049544 RepID=A0ABT7JDU9_9DEIO|nr:hypothetical protein [Deinococcus rhizophilus]MDL2343231.1 hypothetical protein [Deinococcus rhizophilus]